ncbi:TetR/AcrR family transcriptional regulator [Enterococcus sp. LJL99]
MKVALQLFLEKGYEKTTITDIMKKTNLSKGGMYHHFSSKEQILEVALKKALLEELEALDIALNSCNTLASKFTLLFAPALAQSNYVKIFTQFTRNQKKSLIYYKIREIASEFWFEPLKKLLLEGLDDDTFSFEINYIDQITRLLYLYGDDIIFRTPNDEMKTTYLEKEFAAFVYNVTVLVHAKEAFVKEFEEKIFSLI